MDKNIDELLLTDNELYKIAISDKQHHEDRRDEINIANPYRIIP